MKFKWYHAVLPACVSFGPFLMSSMGGLSDHEWMTQMPGAVMMTIALCSMLNIIFEQRKVLDELLEQKNQIASKNKSN
jgi:hypothetical protein